MDSNTTSIKKTRIDSWIDINNNDKNFLGRKRVDYSTFERGTTIPERYHKVFLDNLSAEVTKGKQVKIKLYVNDKLYNAVIRWPNSKDRKGTTIQLLYSNKSLKELLQNRLDVSYNYIINYIKQNDKKPNTIPKEYAEYIDFYKGDKLDTFAVYFISKTTDKTEDEELDEDINDEVDDEFYPVKSISEELNYIHKFIVGKGFTYDQELIYNFYLSIKTKPFVILSGISGTGKSKIVQLFAEAVGARYKIVPVRPDWSDATDLLGYRNIENQFTPGIITSIAYEAMKHSDKPYFLCLDEMNLARVEYYFSDILSLMETRHINENGEIVTDTLLGKEQFGRDEGAFGKYGDVYIPQNLYIIGTVNMDETTFPFSKKVLDRANTIEFNKVDLKFDFDAVIQENIENKNYHNDFLKSEYLKLIDCSKDREMAAKTIEVVVDINNILEKYNYHFGFRVRDEIVFYTLYALKNEIMDFDKAMDFSIVQKILPKINGSGNEVLDVLIDMYNFLNDTTYNSAGYLEDEELKKIHEKAKESKYKMSSEKLVHMMGRFVRDGFTTFWQ